MMAQRNALYGGRPVIEPPSPLEQPIAARPSPVNADYLSWTATAAYSPMSPPMSQYSPMGAHTMPPQPVSSPNTSSSCALAGNTSYSAPPPPPQHPQVMGGAGNGMTANTQSPVTGGGGGVGGGGGGGVMNHNNMGGLGSSIANLRLKAQEYNMQQTRYPMQHQMAQ